VGIEVNGRVTVLSAPGRTVEPRLLVHRKQQLERAVDQIVGFQDGEHGRHADTVVRAQGGSGRG
jgi:hypothetical protein